jgi:two-component sensor histidine kinase
LAAFYALVALASICAALSFLPFVGEWVEAAGTALLMLMREINHRAKNMLSVVDSIAHQTAAKDPEDFVERFSERIQALSANQDLLVRNEWNGVEIEDLVPTIKHR